MVKLAGPMATVVYGEGPQNAKIMLIGQNPGSEEVRQGRPFVGRTGKYLDSVLIKNVLNRSQLYITSVVKETTPANRKPTVREVERWIPFLLKELEHIKPQIVVLMGTVARKTPRLEGIEYIETCHPSAAMRFPSYRKRFESDFAMLANKLKRLQQMTKREGFAE